LPFLPVLEKKKIEEERIRIYRIFLGCFYRFRECRVMGL